MSEPITIKKLIERISSGDIRIPAFQRDFVWEPDQVAFLLDSIYKEFPIGTVILWKTDNRLNSEKRLGCFKLPPPQKDYPVNYVLDGQQRLTSLFSVFQTDLEPVSGEWVDIYFDMAAEEAVQESLFVALDESEVDPARHFPVKTFFDSVAYRQATNGLEDEVVVKLDNVQDKFRTYLIPNETFETDDRNKVAIVFERINRAGTELDVFELLAAWSWSDQFDLVQKFRDLEEKIEDHNYDDLCKERDLLLKICSGIISGSTTPRAILDLQGDDIRARFAEIEAGVLGAIDFLRREVGVKHYKMLPFPALLAPLSAFFATTKADGQKYTSKQKDLLVRWFWISVFSRRFTSDVNEKQASDIRQMLKLKADENASFNLPKNEVKIDFAQTNFSSGNANSKALIAMLNAKSPKSLLSGAAVDLDKVLKKGSKHEFHHIFPRAYLESKGVDRQDINILANICFLTRSDNNKIKDKSPADYGKDIASDRRTEYLDGAILPADFDSVEYADFIERRSAMLIDEAKRLMDPPPNDGDGAGT